MVTETMSVAAPPTLWTLDPNHTQVGFAIKHMMFATVRGSFREIEGTIELGSEEDAPARVDVRIAAAAIDTGIEARNAHLRSPDFFEVDRFPWIVFEGVGTPGALKPGKRFLIQGILTIRDVTRPVVLDTVFEGRGVDPDGVERVAFTAEARLNRRDFGLTWNQALEAGGVLVGDDVRITLAVQAIPPQEVREVAR